MEHLIAIHLFGDRYEVPNGLTVIEAMEYVGLREKHDHGCHSGVCGRCAVWCRMGEHGKKFACFACQTRAVDGMHITAIPEQTMQTCPYRLEQLTTTPDTIRSLYPEIDACIHCGRCTAVCPKGLAVEKYVAYAKCGDFEGCAQASIACVMCGACAAECPVGILQLQIALLSRRLCGRDTLKTCDRLATRVSQIEHGDFAVSFDELLQTTDEPLSDINSAKNAPKTPLPPMSETEKADLLSTFHPDYREDGFTVLTVGANKGERVPKELALLLQAHSRISDEIIDLTHPHEETDVLVIGGGGAGCTTAIEAKQDGAKVMLVTKFRIGDGNTVMAKGGIQASETVDDPPTAHFLDSFVGGHCLSQPALLSKLACDAPSALQWLAKQGVNFDKDADGEMSLATGGGLSGKRMHAVKDHTGAEIMRVLQVELQNSGVHIVENTAAVELVLDNHGGAAGAVLLDRQTGNYRLVKAKTVVLATGGSGGLHCQGFSSTNYAGSTADGLVLGYRVGAALRDANSLQYHPTGIADPKPLLGLLVTEKARSLGADLLNRYGEPFVHALEPRDVVTAAIIRECTERHNGISTENGVGVWLNTPLIDQKHGDGTIERELPSTFELFSKHGIDIRKQPILVYPSLHYQNGGIEINQDGSSTTVPRLFAVGETAGGIHGKNRLMGNSLADIVVFGRIVGKQVAKTAQDVTIDSLSLEHVSRFEQALRDAGISSDTVSPKLL